MNILKMSKPQCVVVYTKHFVFVSETCATLHVSSKPTHVETCLVSNITWHIPSAKVRPRNVVMADVDHLLYSWLF